MIDKEKQRLRVRMRDLAALNRKGDSDLILRTLLNLAPWKSASTVLLYSSLPAEPDTEPLMLEQGARSFLYPRIEGERLGLYRRTPESRWVTGPHGLQEPDPETWEPSSPEEVDLALVPGMAFDPKGGRLGRGGGYYDRLLGDPLFRGVKIGLSWEWQFLPSVPRGNLDIAMDLVISGREVHGTINAHGELPSKLDKPGESG